MVQFAAATRSAPANPPGLGTLAPCQGLSLVPSLGGTQANPRGRRGAGSPGLP